MHLFTCVPCVLAPCAVRNRANENPISLPICLRAHLGPAQRSKEEQPELGGERRRGYQQGGL